MTGNDGEISRLRIGVVSRCVLLHGESDDSFFVIAGAVRVVSDVLARHDVRRAPKVASRHGAFFVCDDVKTQGECSEKQTFYLYFSALKRLRHQMQCLRHDVDIDYTVRLIPMRTVAIRSSSGRWARRYRIRHAMLDTAYCAVLPSYLVDL